jgi:hypothetical protein
MPDIQILQIDEQTGLVSLGMGRSPKMLSGIELLAQVVSLGFLKNTGRDVIDPADGTGLRDAIGQYNFSTGDELKVLVIQRAKALEKDILAKQSAGTIDPTERLKKLLVLNVAADTSTGTVLAKVRVVNEAGGTQDILV